MNEQNKARLEGPANVDSKRSWSKPTLARIDAEKAELGTRVDVLDGGFTTS